MTTIKTSNIKGSVFQIKTSVKKILLFWMMPSCLLNFQIFLKLSHRDSTNLILAWQGKGSLCSLNNESYKTPKWNKKIIFSSPVFWKCVLKERDCGGRVPWHKLIPVWAEIALWKYSQMLILKGVYELQLTVLSIICVNLRKA
jgi:hypothetical protein